MNSVARADITRARIAGGALSVRRAWIEGLTSPLKIPDTKRTATIAEAVRWTLDTKAVKAEMGVAWYDAHCRQSLITTVAVKPRALEQKIAA